jgi:hypothetical protein
MSKVLSVRVPEEFLNDFNEWCDAKEKNKPLVIKNALQRVMDETKVKDQLEELNENKFNKMLELTK